MDSKIAGVASLLAPSALIAMWSIHLTSARPGSFDSLKFAISTAKYALSPSESGTWFFIITLISISLCLASSAILFFGKNKLNAMYLIGVHSFAALFIYSWALAFAIALPLIFYAKMSKKIESS